MLAACLLEPLWRDSSPKPGANLLAVVVDDSRSLQVREPDGELRRDAAGEPVSGDPSKVATVTDIWTFARNTRSRNPNWTLVATEAPN